MSNSYRIRTQVGVDKYVNVQLDQDFEFLEILSLKILQSEIYIRPCSDYGVVVGRISVNNGFGIPNAKVSIFIPLSTEDESNPVISDLYPYKNLSSINDDGYRYNLLPYTQSYSNHTPTGTFPTRKDVLTNPYLIEVFDKYYKYTCTTNDSGDFMIFGVPLGSQTIHVDVDLSDIGEFSLSPQDLIRMGIATESQVAGTKFKSSTNLGELPQLIQFNRIIDVQPLWGEPEICNLGITRTDFDLTSEANINITPTAIFMGSLVSSNEDQAQKANCKPRLKQGNLCNLVTGPGEILAIRQTIRQDIYGRPGLEVHPLQEGGQVIDENGAWMIELEMNMDRVVTNEFGQQVLTSDPKAGIPTSAKYRFKIKWNQAPSLKEQVKRGYFLVPNIKEYGWASPSGPDPINSLGSGSINQDFLKSYAFSVDWNDYGNTGTTIGQKMIQEAINAEDRFYYMEYNKVYTVSQLISQYRNGYASNRILSIKNILEDTCESENNKFPTNDSNFRFDIIYLLFYILMMIFKIILPIIVIILHVVSFLLALIDFLLIWVITPVISILIGFLLWESINNLIRVPPNPWASASEALAAIALGGILYLLIKWKKQIKELKEKLTNLTLPNLTYPDCDMCDCGEPQPIGPPAETIETTSSYTVGGLNVNSVLSQYPNSNLYNGVGFISPYDQIYGLYLSNVAAGDSSSPNNSLKTRSPQGGYAKNNEYAFTTSLTLAERINLFNVKAKYFNASSSNPGGGVNRIKSSFNYPINNPGFGTGSETPNFHFDNMLIISLEPGQSLNFGTGDILTFQDIKNSTDINYTGVTSLNQFGTTSITGTSLGTQVGSYSVRNVNLTYANPNGNGNISVQYAVTGFTGDTYLKFPIDIEYFQVITGMTYAQFKQNLAPAAQLNSNFNTLPNRVFNTAIRSSVKDNCCLDTCISGKMSSFVPIDNFQDGNNQFLLFLVRGVDPNSSRNPNKYDLSLLFGYNSYGNKIISGDYKLNWPIQNSTSGSNLKAGSHIRTNSLTNDTYANIPLYFDSFNFQPSVGQFSAFTSSLPGYYSSLDNNFSFAGASVQVGGKTISDVDFNKNSTFGLSNIVPNNRYSLGNYATLEFYSRPDLITDYGSPGSFGLYSSAYPTLGTNCQNTTCSPWVPPFVFWAYSLNSVPTINSSYSTNNRGVIQNNYLNKLTLNTGSQSTFNCGYYGGELLDGGSLLFYYLVAGVTPGTTSYPCNLGVNGVYISPSYKTTTTTPYNLTYSTLGGFGRTMVMRSDRLPTSDIETKVKYNSNLPAMSFCLQNNLNLGLYKWDDEGTLTPVQGNTIASGFATPGENTFQNGSISSLSNSFTCAGMVPLSCYYIDSNGEPKVRPSTDSCFKSNDGDKIFKGGCYILVTKPISSLGKDLQLCIEWNARIQIIFAACRNVWSHHFTNNWINGTLYAFSINNDRFFTSPTANPPNKPFSEYCRETLILHPQVNNFYYRCTPYIDSTGFIGRIPNQGTYGPQIFGAYGGNKKFLGFPTTILDLGPKTNYIQELVMSDKYDGYVTNKMNSTTYQDVSEILNVFILSRLINASFLQLLFSSGGASVFAYFSRSKSFVDADYAQMISINSELGVIAFQAENYPDDPSGQDPVFFNNGKGDPIFGIFFSADNQTRDYITPKRTIINSNIQITNPCAFNNFGGYSQRVPFYEWYIKNNTSVAASTPPSDTIFGSQLNEWWTDTINDGTTSNMFHSYKYQSLDRLNKSSRYFQTFNQSSSNYFKGYIFAVKNQPPNVGDESPLLSNWDNPSGDARYINVGAPFHFYFGLKKGGSAFDKFAKKYLNFDNIIDE